MNKRTIMLAVAGILAIGAGLLTFNYLSSANKQGAAVPERPVLVAAQAIPAHTAITPDMVHVVMRSADAIDPNALSNESQANGIVALANLPAGSAITSSNTSTVAMISLATRLHPGMRAISIPVDDVKDVSGMVQPGDHVDVIAIPPRVTTTQPKAYTILRDIEVLAVGGSVNFTNAAPQNGQNAAQQSDARTVTLEVTASQADLLAMADLNSVLRLALRTPREKAEFAKTEQIVFANPDPPSAPNAPAKPSGPAPDPRPHRVFLSPVVVIDGDRIDGPDGAQH